MYKRTACVYYDYMYQGVYSIEVGVEVGNCELSENHG